MISKIGNTCQQIYKTYKIFSMLNGNETFSMEIDEVLSGEGECACNFRPADQRMSYCEVDIGESEESERMILEII